MWPGAGRAVGQGGRCPSPSRELHLSPAVCEDLGGPDLGPGCGGGRQHPQGRCRAEAACCLLVCLQDSVLAFWSHGMQGRSLDTNEVSGTLDPRCPWPGGHCLLGEEPLGWPQCPFSSQVTQEITDETRIFRVLGAHR